MSAGSPLDDGLEIENNLAASDSCMCINPQVKAVLGCSHKCQFILQNVALLFPIRTSHCYNFQEESSEIDFCEVQECLPLDITGGFSLLSVKY